MYKLSQLYPSKRNYSGESSNITETEKLFMIKN
jgi:hypothetical protein